MNWDEYVNLYKRVKIGFNIHNRGDYTVGSFRLFELPANGVMQISDGGGHLNDFVEVGKEVLSYKSADNLLDIIGYYLTHEEERLEIARAGYRRVLKDYKIKHLLHIAAEKIENGIKNKTCIK